MTETREGYAVSWSARHICAPSGAGWLLAYERPLREVMELAGGGPMSAEPLEDNGHNNGGEPLRPSARQSPHEVRL